MTKYILLIIVVILVAPVLYKNFFASKEPAGFTAALAQQQNPFPVHKDSAARIWKRAAQYLEENKLLIGAGDLQQDDSTYYIPYSNSHKKGSSIRIEQHAKGDSVWIYAQWWYSQIPEEKGAKEIALYMQRLLTKYDFK